MKTNFYCVNTNFFDYGKQMAILETKSDYKKPNNLYRQVPGLSALKIWLVNERVARQLVEGINDRSITFDDLLGFYSDIKGLAA